ncbi:MAG: hypothetical protein JWQ89_718 [Devosia sp.]|uniref:glycoside hydrolase family 2 protein n=1 Tax=Devosia sp. TaxID=1871048 RepID=UPI0026052EB5|nr:glycoside hydrolase family 2 TIM barrel-domain containing protein [Devosia sp.]MDB5538991.1 hypothetical protein [Devosia sp.]
MIGEAPAAKAGASARAEISLDGTWRFRLEGQGNWREAFVPGPWQAEFADLRHSTGKAIYARQVSIPAEWRGREIAVRFGAVNYFSEVRLNGRVLGTHEGGYLPFEFVIPADTPAESEMEVHVTLPSGDAEAYPDYPFGEIPHGKQSWYGPLGGIWQSVKLLARDERHVSQVAISADPDTGEVTLDLTLSPAAAGATVRASIGGVSAETTGTTLKLQVAAPALWSPEAPNLHSLKLELVAGGAVVDITTQRFGFRKIETRDGKFFLNGQPLYLRGALDQDYYPQGICTPPSVEFLEDQLKKAKHLGLNLLRVHIKVPDPRYYEVADRLGVLIWTEIPNVQYFTAAAAQRMRDTMSGIIERDGNHPSIIAWTIINEDWGTRLVENADHRQWLKDTYDWLKAKDPRRLVVDNSACIPNFHVKTDINDYHYYKSVPERRDEWERLTEEFAGAADWTWTPHGDGERRGDEPLVVSEFGVWGLPHPDHVKTPAGEEPWWAETGGNWGDGAAYPHGIQNRFATYHLDKVFGSFDAFIDEVQWYQFANLKYEIESMRAHAPIQGYVITEMTDVHWEANGLLDINRNPRIFHDRFAEVNSDTVIVPQIARHAVYSGEAAPLHLKVATGGKAVPAGATLTWSVDGASGKLDVPATGALAVADLGTTPITLSGETRVATIALTLEAGGKLLARNQILVSVYARRSAGPARIAAADPQLAAFAGGLGYTVSEAASADLILSHGLGEADIEAMRHGARYLVLADGSAPTHRNLRLDPPGTEPPTMRAGTERARHLGAESQLPNIGLVLRDGTLWRGDWIANFSWIKRSGAFATLPGGPLLDVSFDRVVPHHVLTGFRSWEYDGLVDAGVVIGWINKPAATIARRRVGKGGLVATTFRLTNDAPGIDPVAAALFDGLVTTTANLEVD